MDTRKSKCYLIEYIEEGEKIIVLYAASGKTGRIDSNESRRGKFKCQSI